MTKLFRKAEKKYIPTNLKNHVAHGWLVIKSKRIQIKDITRMVDWLRKGQLIHMKRIQIAVNWLRSSG